ncbi:MAG: glycosyltransferase family 2 protein [Microgenomates group bacterium]
MTKAPLISIIITNFNAKRWLDKCIGSIRDQKFKDYEIVFVNDGSTDGSFEYAQKKFPECVFVNSIANAGFARANNLGAMSAQGEYLFILNADTYLEKDTLSKLAATLKKHPRYKIAQLDIRRYDKANMDGEACTFQIDRFGYPIWSGKDENPFYADAAAMIIKKGLFFKIGGFDDRFYIYLEDLDLAWRARLLGNTVYYLQGIHVYHFAGGTSVSTQVKEGTYATSLRRRYDAQKNNLRTLIKNVELSNLVWQLPGSTLLASGEGFLYLLKGNVAGFLALHNAILWNILNVVDSLRERAKVQKMRTIGDFEIFKNADRRISKLSSLISYGIPKMNQ